MRLAYTRSVAASSMAGFIVGLGDRHTSNILVRQVRESPSHDLPLPREE